MEAFVLLITTVNYYIVGNFRGSDMGLFAMEIKEHGRRFVDYKTQSVKKIREVQVCSEKSMSQVNHFYSLESKISIRRPTSVAATAVTHICSGADGFSSPPVA